VDDLKNGVENDPNYPAVLFFYQEDVAQGEGFFGHLWPEARAVSDPTKRFYHAFGLKRGSFKQTLGPQAIACGIRASAKGHFVTKPTADVWQMPGLFIVEGELVLWAHEFDHVGDIPDWAEVPQMGMTV